VRDGAELEVKIRMGETELIKEAGSRGLGLRVLKDDRAAVTYTSDFDAQAMRGFAEESVALCRLAEPDPLAALPSARRWRGRSLTSTCGTSRFCQFDVAEAMRWARRASRLR
jgi:PmbA protein